MQNSVFYEKLKYMSNIIFSKFSERYVHKSLVFIADEVISVAISVILYWLASSLLHYDVPSIFYLYIILFAGFSSFVGIYLFKTYSGIVRHTTITEVMRLVGASFAKSALLLLLLLLLLLSSEYASLFNNGNVSYKFLLTVSLVDVVFTSMAFVLMRSIISFTYQYILRRAALDNVAKRLMVYGEDDAAVSAASMLIKCKDYIFDGYVVVDTTKKSSKGSLSGYNLYKVESESSFQDIVFKKGIKGVVFPSYDSARLEQDRMIAFCAKHDIEVLISTGINEITEGSAIMPPIREVKIEDLLGREQVEINMDEIRAFLTDKVVMVTGAAGSIGSELCRQLLRIPIQKLILFDSAETPMNDIMLELKDKSHRIEKKFVIGDVRQRPKLEYVFKRYQPNVVFHAAAYKHVPMMENNPVEAVNTNVFGTMNVANMSLEFGVEKFVMVSTDKAVNPANVMGASKRIAEIYTQSMSRAIAAGKLKGKTKYVTTRFGNVLGSNGSVIPLFKKQIAAGGPVTVTDPRIIRYFMTIPEACRLVLEAATMGKEDEIFVFDMGDPVKIADLAKNMITLAGLEVDKDIKIEYVGLRPGEKLYEELLSNEENTVPTQHKKIFLAKVRDYEYEDVNKWLEQLREAAVTMDKDSIVSQMKEIVPEFKSCNSRYGRLDK